MKFVTGLLAAVLLLAGISASHAVVRIADDRGGRIGTYVDKYQGLRSSGETVIIDGLCASACTIVLGAVPHDRICVTSAANLDLPPGSQLRLLEKRGAWSYVEVPVSADEPTRGWVETSVVQPLWPWDEALLP